MFHSIDLVEFHSFLKSGLPRQAVVLDLGANKGRFSRKMKDRYSAQFILVEANPELYEKYLRNGPGAAFNIAIAGAPGSVDLRILENNLASTIMNAEGEGEGRIVSVRALDLETFCREANLDRIDLLKVDIEGAEIGMLNACSEEFLKAIPQITIEFHDFCGMTPAPIVSDCLDRLKALGSEAIRFSRVGHQDTLLIQRDLVPVSNMELFWLRHGYRNIKGAVRIARKAVLGKGWARGYS